MDKPTGVVITCTGSADDPDIQEKIAALLKNVSQATGVDETSCNLKSVEPWNSVKVSFDLPREAAVRLQELARSGDDALINLGILSVQIANGEALDLNAIRDLLQQPPPTLPMPPQQVAPQQMPPKQAPPEHSGTPTVPAPYQQMRLPHQPPQQRLPGASQPLHAPTRLPNVNQARKQAPKQSPGVPPQLPPSRPASSGTLMSPQPPASPATSFVGLPNLHNQMLSSGGMKPLPYPMGHVPASSIGNIPTGIPSLHLGHPSKSFNSPNPSMNISTSNSFSSVYSIAMSVGGNPNAPIQAPMMQSLPNLPTPQAAPVGNFPWNLGAKPHQFATGVQPPALPQWNQPMFPGGPNLPTNLPGSIPSIGPLPTPSRMPAQSAPPAKPKKKKKRPRKPPKDKIPRIPLPPPLMPPSPKPPSTSESAPLQKPMGMPLPAGLNPISPNEAQVMPNQGGAPAAHQQHPRFPFTQAQVSQAGKSDVSMTSPLLVNLLQSDIAATQFPAQAGEQQMKAAGGGPGPPQGMMNPASMVSSHPHGATMPVSLNEGSHFPQGQQPQVYPHLFHGHQQQQQQHLPPLPQLSSPNQPLRPDLGRSPNENLQQLHQQQQQQQQQPFSMPYHPGAPGNLPVNFNRFPLPPGHLPPDHLQFMMQQVSQAGLMEQRMQLPHSQGNWMGALPTMTTVPPAASPAMGVPSTATTTTAPQSVPPPKEPPKKGDSRSTSFDEESAMAGMTEAERDTFAAAAKIAQDTSKPGGIDVDAFEALVTPTSELPIGKKGDFQVPTELQSTISSQNKVAAGMFAIENLAASHQQPEKKSRKSPKVKRPPPGQLHRTTMGESSVRQDMAGGESFPELSPEQLRNLKMQIASGRLSNENIDLSSLQSSSASSSMTQRMTPPVPFHQKSQPEHVLHNPFLHMPSVPSSTGSGPEGPSPNQLSQFAGVPGGSVPNMGMPQGWPSGGPMSSKADGHDSMGKSRGVPVDSRGKAAGPSKQPSMNPHEWPFSNISPPTQNLSTEGLQFMAKLAAVPGDAGFKPQQPQYLLPDGSKPSKEDKPHLKALLNEMSSSMEGQATSPRPTKRLSSEEKSERKRRKSSPRPAPPPDQGMYQPQRRVDHPGGSVEFPRVPTAEELSFSVQQARAHSLDLLRSGTGYPPMPKSAPSSPRAKSRTKSVENIAQYGLQQSDLYRSKHGTLSPVTPMSGSFKGSTGSSKSKSKESKSRSKSPKASGNRSSKQDASGLQSNPPVTTSANVPFAGVHEFHPPPGLNIRGPTNPLPYQSRKTHPQAMETQSPMSPHGVSPQFAPKQYQPQPQNQIPPPGSESQRKSPRASRPSSPFAPSASALLSSFALSAFSKGPEPPTSGSGAAESPIHSPGFVTSPPLQKISTPTLPSNVSLGPPEEGFPEELLSGPAKARTEGTPSFPAPTMDEAKRHPQSSEQEQLPMERILSPSGFVSGQSGCEGHPQSLPYRFHSVNQPGPPPLWRPPTSKQPAASFDPRAPVTNVTMPLTGPHETQNESAMRRSVGMPVPRPVQSLNALGTAGEVAKGHQLISGDNMLGKGNHGHGGFSVSSLSSTYTGHSAEVFSLRHPGVGVDSKASIGQTKMDQDSAIAMSRQHPKDPTFESRTGVAFSPGLTSTVQHTIGTSSISPGHLTTRMTKDPRTPQEGSGSHPFPGAVAPQRGFRHSGPGGSRSPRPVPHSSGNVPAPFSVSSLVSRPSPTQGGQRFGEDVSALPSPQLGMSADSNLPHGSPKSELASPIHPPAAPPVRGESSNVSGGAVGEFKSGPALQKNDHQKPGNPATAIPTQGAAIGRGSHVTATSLPYLPAQGMVSGAPETGGADTSSVTPAKSEHLPLPGGPSSDSDRTATTTVSKPPMSEEIRPSNVTTLSSDIIPPGGGVASTSMHTGSIVSSRVSDQPEPTNAASGTQLGSAGERPLQPESSDGGQLLHKQDKEAHHEPRADVNTPPAMQGVPAAGSIEDGGKKDEESDTMKFIALEDYLEGKGEDSGADDLLQETRPPGSDQGDEEEGPDDGDGSTSRKRSMRASGRDMYYGPIPTYKRRKPNQK